MFINKLNIVNQKAVLPDAANIPSIKKKLKTLSNLGYNVWTSVPIVLMHGMYTYSS